MTTKPRPYRLRAVHRRMSFETFHRTVPFRPGWKREYYDGKAHLRPSWTAVFYELDLTHRPERRVPGLRACQPSDRGGLVAAFIDSFRYAPEYASYPMRSYRRKAAEYIDGCLGTVRGEWSPASAVIEQGGEIAAAALVKTRPNRPPLLDCLLVRPAYFRRGFATAVVTRAANRLLRLGHTALESGAMLANEPSLAWHTAYGFRERPDFLSASARYYCGCYELQRQEKYGLATPEQLATLKQKVADLKAAYRRALEMKENGAYRDPFLDCDE